VQYLAVRYTERLAEAGVVASVGSKGDSYDNALAESFNGLYKAELIHHEGPWQGLEDVEFATCHFAAENAPELRGQSAPGCSRPTCTTLICRG
jgi:transposase InsO family protein